MKWVLGISVIGVAMAWAATGTIPAAPASIDDVSLRFLPPETQGLAFVDVAALRSAPLVQEVLSRKDVKYPGKLEDFIAATGIDPRRDLDRVTMAKLTRDAFLVAQGRLDKFKIEQYLKDQGKRSEAYLGQTVYRDGDRAVAVLDNNIVVTGQVDAVKKALDQRQLPGSPPLRSDLVSAIQSIEAGNQVWAVGDVSVENLGAMGVRSPEPVADMMKALRSGTYQMRIDTGIHAKAVGTFADAQSAKDTGDLARGALAVVKLQAAKQRPEMLPLLSGVDVSTSGSTVVVRIEESGEALKKLK
jgi:hypothetical protein